MHKSKTKASKKNVFTRAKINPNKIPVESKEAGREKISRFAVIGIIGVILMYVGVAGVVSVTSPWWLGKGDAPRHIDYAWRVYNKQLPKFEDGLQQKNLQELRKNLYRNQPAASNPPFFYALHAPVIGPSLKMGQWQKATAIGRAVNVFIGVLCVLALAWAGWLYGSRGRKNMFVVAVPAIGVMMHYFTTLNLNYAVDVLLVLIGTLSLVAVHKIINKGIKTKYIFWITLLSIAGMATKITYIVFLIVALMALVFVPILHNTWKNKPKLFKNISKSFVLCIVILASVALTIGWFYYYHNYKVTGNFITAIPPTFQNTRPSRSTYDVLTSTKLWALLYNGYTAINTLSVALIGFASAGIIMIFNRLKFSAQIKNKKHMALIFLLWATFTGMFLIQVIFAAGSGNYFFRYLIPALLPMALFISYGLLEPKWTKGQVVVFFSFMMGISTIYKSSRFDLPEYLLPSWTEIYESFKTLPKMVSANGISTGVYISLLCSFMLGGLVLSWSMYNLSRMNEKTK